MDNEQVTRKLKELIFELEASGVHPERQAKNLTAPRNETILKQALWMARRADDMPAGPTRTQWLGFIQGLCWSAAGFSLGELGIDPGFFGS